MFERLCPTRVTTARDQRMVENGVAEDGEMTTSFAFREWHNNKNIKVQKLKNNDFRSYSIREKAFCGKERCISISARSVVNFCAFSFRLLINFVCIFRDHVKLEDGFHTLRVKVGLVCKSNDLVDSISQEIPFSSLTIVSVLSLQLAESTREKDDAEMQIPTLKVESVFLLFWFYSQINVITPFWVAVCYYAKKVILTFYLIIR